MRPDKVEALPSGWKNRGPSKGGGGVIFAAESNGAPRARTNGKATRPKPTFASVDDAVSAMLSWESFDGGKHAATWHYNDSFAIVRFNFSEGEKKFRPVSRVAGRWRIADPDGPLPLFRLDALWVAEPTELVIVCEGEGCAIVAADLGLCATTSAHGSNSSHKTDFSPFAGRDAVVLPDHDAAGERYATAVGNILTALDPPATVRILRLPGLGDGGDIVDWVAALRPEADASDLLAELIETRAEPFAAAEPAVPAKVPSDAPDVHMDGDRHKTEVGLAKWLVHLHGNRLRFCKAKGWLVWNGAKWARDTVQTAKRLVVRTIDHILTRARKLPEDDPERTALAKFALGCETSSRIRGTLDIAEAHSTIAVEADDLNANLALLNLTNGTYDLDRHEFREHDPANLITKTAGCIYDETATCIRWEAFLQTVLAGDAELIAFIQKAVGYTLTADTSERCFFLCHGPGANGKSVFQNVVKALLGDYGAQSDYTTFMPRSDDAVRGDIAKLDGVRGVSVSEIPEGRRLAEGRMKMLTGQDPIACRFLYHEEFTYMPRFKLWMYTNDRPRVKEQSDAFWERVRLIPFTVVIPKAKRDHGLTDALLAELPGILQWALRGLKAWQRPMVNGVRPPGGTLKEPAVVTKATSAYRKEEDTVGLFLDEYCEQGEHYTVGSKELWEAFMESTGEKIARRRFGNLVGKHGFEQGEKRHGGLRPWVGLRLIEGAG